MITPSRYLIEKAIKKNIPLSCLFELTYKCNLRCLHCYLSKKTGKELSKKAIFNILEQLKDAGCLFLTFSGGEILARRDFFEIAGYARALNFVIRLFTNGTLITEGVADKIKELNPRKIEISLYGFAQAHDKTTQVKGSFQRTIQGMRFLCARGMNVYAKVIPMRHNAGDVDALNRFVREEVGARVWEVNGGLLITPCDNGDKRPLKYRLTDQQLRDIAQKELVYLKELGRKCVPRVPPADEQLCGAGIKNCNITAYGELNPCVQIRLKNNNDLNRVPFIDIWKNNEWLKKMRSLRFSDRVDCRGCSLAGFCGFCAGVAFLQEGSLTAKFDEACRLARIGKETYDAVYY